MSNVEPREREVSGFPPRAVLNGAIAQTRGDLLSLKAVYLTAVVLALAAEIFPDASNAMLGDRVGHGIAVVVGALVAITLADLAQRLALYRRRCRRIWTIKAREHSQQLGFAIEPLPPGEQSPFPVEFVIRTPSGRHLQPHAQKPATPVIRRVYPPGTWAHIVEPDYEHGSYEVRVYTALPWIEIARATLNV